jgi:hypothetical protein
MPPKTDQVKWRLNAAQCLVEAVVDLLAFRVLGVQLPLELLTE